MDTTIKDNESGKISNRLGRPPSPRKTVRSNRIVTFLTDRQMAKLQELAERDGMSLSRVCYSMLKRHLD